MIFTYYPKFYLLVYIYTVTADGGFLLNTFKEMYRQSCLNNYANSCTNNSQMHYINAISLMNCLFLTTTQNPVNRSHMVGGCTCMHVPVFNSS